MKIKEVAKQVGITPANIRYYEKEGLLNPERNERNNYRDYGKDEINRLEEIKKLRLLGVSIEDIKRLYVNKTSVTEIMEKRLVEIREEKRNLKFMEDVCKKAVDEQVDVYHLEKLKINQQKEEWQRRVAVFIKEDITKEKITEKQFHFHVMLMLIWGCLLSALLSIILKTEAVNHGSYLVFESGIILIVMYILTYFYTNILVHVILFHISVISQSVLMFVLMHEMFDSYAGYMLTIRIDLVVMWMGLALYILILYVMSKSKNGILKKFRYVLLIWIVFMLIFWGIMIFCQGDGKEMKEMIFVMVIMTVFSFCFSVVWNTAVINRKEYNRYDAAETSARLMNMIGTLFGACGHYSSGNIFRR